MRPGRLSGLVRNEYTYTNVYDDNIRVETSGAYGEIRSALDEGDHMGIIDAIDAEDMLKYLDDDLPAKAAAMLVMSGWDPATVGTVIHDARPGSALLVDASERMSDRKRLEDASHAEHRNSLRQRGA